MNIFDGDTQRITMPMICDNCGNKVTVNGTVTEGVITFTPCPACQAETPDQVLVATQQEPTSKDMAFDEQHTINVMVGFKSDGEIQEASFRLGPYPDVISAMQAMTNCACITFQNGDAAIIKLEYIRQELQELPDEIKRQYLDYLSSVLTPPQEGDHTDEA